MLCFTNIYPAKRNAVISMMFTCVVFLVCLAEEKFTCCWRWRGNENRGTSGGKPLQCALVCTLA